MKISSSIPKIILAVLLFGGLTGFALVSYRAHHRSAWKDAALAELTKKLSNPDWAQNRLITLKQAGPEDTKTEGGWFTPELVMTKNGEWIAFTNICRKEDWRIDDLFIGYGSDHQWYYSSYHFCIGAYVLKMLGQPDSLATLVKEYYLRPFDGKSDTCLNKTWP